MFFGQQDGDVRGGGGRAVAGLIGRRAQVDVAFGQPRPLLDLERVLGQPPGLEGFEVHALARLRVFSSVFSSNPSFTDIMVPAVS